MDYKLEKGNITFTDFKVETLGAFCKFNMEVTIGTEENEDQLIISSREADKDEFIILYEGKRLKLTFNKLLNIISNILKEGQPIVKISNNDFKKFKSLVLIADRINSDLVEKCYIIDVDPKNKYYSCIFPDINKLPNKFYYFEINDSLLIFNKYGFDIIYDKYSSVEDVFI